MESSTIQFGFQQIRMIITIPIQFQLMISSQRLFNSIKIDQFSIESDQFVIKSSIKSMERSKKVNKKDWKSQNSTFFNQNDQFWLNRLFFDLNCTFWLNWDRFKSISSQWFDKISRIQIKKVKWKPIRSQFK